MDRKITIKLGEKEFKLTASSPQMEEAIRLAAGTINNRLKDYTTRHPGKPIVDMVWHLAVQLGYGNYFVLEDGGYVTDDHLPINRILHTPCIDIIPCFAGASSSFGPTWHTINDTPENIDPGALQAVGQTLLQLIYNDNE